MEKSIIQKRRLEAHLTLREIAKAMGPGFSRARLSILERGLTNVPVPTSDQAAILETIERLAPLHQHRRRIVAIARDMDFAPFVADVRDARRASAQA